MTKVAVIERSDGVDSQLLNEIPAALAFDQQAIELQRLFPTQLADLNPDTDAVFVREGYWNEIDKLLEMAPEVSWIHVNMTGVDHLPVKRLKREGVRLTTCRGVLDRAIAEFVLGGVLLWSKGLLRSQVDTRNRVVVHREPKANSELSALIIGSGSIGSECARTLRNSGFNKLTGIRRRPDPLPEFDEVHGPEDLGRLIAENDVVIACLPANDDTHGMIGRAQLEQLKSSSVFINVGRGPTVDNLSLAKAMLVRPNAAAVLDVTSPEPLPPDHPLWECANVVISPHMSGDTACRHDAFTSLFIENLQRYCRGKDLLNQVVAGSE